MISRIVTLRLLVSCAALLVTRDDSLSFSCKSPSARCQQACEVECGMRSRGMTTLDGLVECLEAMSGAPFYGCEFAVQATMTYKLVMCSGNRGGSLRLKLQSETYSEVDYIIPDRNELHSFLVWVETGYCSKDGIPVIELAVEKGNHVAQATIPIWQRKVPQELASLADYPAQSEAAFFTPLDPGDTPLEVASAPLTTIQGTDDPPMDEFNDSGCSASNVTPFNKVEPEDLIFTYPTGMVLNVTSWAQSLTEPRVAIPTLWEISSSTCSFPLSNQFYITADQTAYIRMGATDGAPAALALGITALLVSALY